MGRVNEQTLLENKWMAKRHMIKYSASLITRVVQIKTTIRHSYQWESYISKGVRTKAVEANRQTSSTVLFETEEPFSSQIIASQSKEKHQDGGQGYLPVTQLPRYESRQTNLQQSPHWLKRATFTQVSAPQERQDTPLCSTAMYFF